jgi:hypothetical protein
MNSDYMQPITEVSIPMFGDLDTKLRDDITGEFLNQCLEVLHLARSELTGPARTDAHYRHESNLMDGALSAADQVLRSVWAGFHPRPASRGHSTSF